MSTRTYGILAGMIGSALGVWWYSRRLATPTTSRARERGSVIFRNTPTVPPISAEGVI